MTTAANGEEALVLATADPPDLVLSDVMMPVLDGLALLQALRANPLTRTRPVILLSARAGEEARVEGLAARADDNLVKPFTARELLARVEVHISLFRMRNQEAQRAKETIEAELKSMNRLHEVLSRLLGAPNLRAALDEILVATCAMMNSQMGNVQLYEPTNRTLTLATHQGFSQEFIDKMRVLTPDTPSACTAAMNSGRRVMIEDLNENESFRHLLDIGAAGTFRSVQATPVLSRTGALLGVLSTYWRQPHRRSDRDLHLLDLYAREAADVIEHIHTAAELQRSFDEVRSLSGRLLRLQDEERRRLARELHDTTGQMLSALCLQLAVVAKSAATLTPRAQTAMSESSALAKQCLSDIRTLSFLLHPSELDELGLKIALSEYVDGFVKRSGMDVDVEIPSDLRRLPQLVETTIFRMVQECLTNVHLHSDSRTARVRLNYCGPNLVLKVQDSGHGLKPHKTSGVGIASMRERLKQLNGFLEIVSHASGATVKASIPLPPP